MTSFKQLTHQNYSNMATKKKVKKIKEKKIKHLDACMQCFKPIKQGKKFCCEDCEREYNEELDQQFGS